MEKKETIAEREVVKQSRGSKQGKQPEKVLEPIESSALKQKGDHSDIPGWGIDADKDNDPTYPIRKRENEDHKGYSEATRPKQQPITVEVLHSNERPNVSAVFGIQSPPSGLSGVLRRFAFRYSESNLGHWLPLVAADRINEAEGVLDDLLHGHIPNLWAEHGLSAEWKYNRKKFVTKIAVGTAVVSAIIITRLLLSDKAKKGLFKKGLFK